MFILKSESVIFGKTRIYLISFFFLIISYFIWK